jgi:hypothetical protein
MAAAGVDTDAQRIGRLEHGFDPYVALAGEQVQVIAGGRAAAQQQLGDADGGCLAQ